jgi:hypothetical protein
MGWGYPTRIQKFVFFFTFVFSVLNSADVMFYYFDKHSTSTYVGYSELGTDVLCEACQRKVKDKFGSCCVTNDRFNAWSEHVTEGHEISV